MSNTQEYKPNGTLITIYLEHNKMDCRKWFMYLDDDKYKDFETKLIAFVRENAPVLRMGIQND